MPSRARAAQAAARARAACVGRALGVGTARARVRFTVSGERRSRARLAALIFREPSRVLVLKQLSSQPPSPTALLFMGLFFFELINH